MINTLTELVFQIFSTCYETNLNQYQYHSSCQQNLLQSFHSLTKKMISDRLWAFAGYLYPLSAALGSIPYSYDPKTRTVIKSGHAHVLIRIHIFNLIVFCCFLAYQCYDFRKQRDYSSFNLALVTLYSLILLLFGFHLITSQEEHCRFMSNVLVKFLIYMNGKSFSSSRQHFISTLIHTRYYCFSRALLSGLRPK